MRFANDSGAVTLPSPTPTLTASPAATETATPLPTATETPTLQVMATETATPVLETATETATEVLLPSETPTPSETPQPLAGGLRGVYYDNANLSALVLTRSDAEVNFTWPLAPAEGVGADTFSVRWEGYVMPQYSETYTFYTTSDDGVRLWVNNQPLIDNWDAPSLDEQSGQIALSAGQLYPIRLEYYDNSGGAAVSLAWASATLSQEVIPAGQLYLPEYPYQEPTRTATSAATATRTRTNTATSMPTQTAVQSATPSLTPDSQATGLKGEYFDNVDFTSLKVTRTDTKIDFTWTGAPATGVGVDSYSVRWTGYLKPLYSQTYTFYTTSDDGVRLWVNGELLIDNWSSHAPMDDSAQISLPLRARPPTHAPSSASSPCAA